MNAWHYFNSFEGNTQQKILNTMSSIRRESYLAGFSYCQNTVATTDL